MSVLLRWWLAVTGFVADRVTAARHDDRGLTTVEWALLTAGVAAIALVVLAVVKAKADDVVTNIPTGG